MRKLLATLAALVVLAGCGTPMAVGDPPPNPKWFVCKYETTPDGVERLQTGQNPISVSENAFPAGVTPAVGVEFNDAQGRSIIIAEDVGQPEPSPGDCPPPNTTTSTSSTSSTTSTTTTVPPTTTSSPPTPTPFAIEVAPLCPDGTTPEIEITFGNRPDLDGQTGTLTFSTGGSIQLVFDANNTVTIPYPASAGTGPVTMTYTLGAESVTRSTTFPDACAPATTTTTTTTAPTSTTPTTTTTVAPTTTVSPTSTTAGPTTTTPAGATTTTLPPGQPFSFGAAATVCVREVPTIRITFVTPAQFPTLVGQTGTLTMAALNGTVVSTQSLVYTPGATIDLLYPGTRVNADGSIADVPGWNLNAAGFWVRDSSDEFLREGIVLTYVLNPTATTTVTYPPESSTCANPDGPFPPPPDDDDLPPTGSDPSPAALAALALAAGTVLFVVGRRKPAR